MIYKIDYFNLTRLSVKVSRGMHMLHAQLGCASQLGRHEKGRALVVRPVWNLEVVLAGGARCTA